jgi:hypothetical protein
MNDPSAKERSLPMKRSIIAAVFGLLASATAGSSVAQEIPAVGFTALVCRLGVSGTGHYCAPGGQNQLCLDVNDANNGTAVVEVHHGQTFSTHTVTYRDENHDDMLDCGDTIVSVI